MVTAKNIILSYEKNQNIIQNSSFNIKDKEFVIITGPSGSGKSTLLKSFYGKLAISQGSLIVNGIDITEKKYQKTLDTRQDMGIVFQDYKLIKDYTIEENIAAPLKIKEIEEKIIKTQVKNLLNHIQLSHKAHLYPNQLSGGEQQRVSVARALGHNPKIILADEPTGNLDKYSANIVWDLLQNVNKQLDITVVVATHKIPTNLEVDYKQYDINNGMLNEVS